MQNYDLWQRKDFGIEQHAMATALPLESPYIDVVSCADGDDADNQYDNCGTPNSVASSNGDSGISSSSEQTSTTPNSVGAHDSCSDNVSGVVVPMVFGGSQQQLLPQQTSQFMFNPHQWLPQQQFYQAPWLLPYTYASLQLLQPQLQQEHLQHERLQLHWEQHYMQQLQQQQHILHGAKQQHLPIFSSAPFQQLQQRYRWQQVQQQQQQHEATYLQHSMQKNPAPPPELSLQQHKQQQQQQQQIAAEQQSQQQIDAVRPHQKNQSSLQTTTLSFQFTGTTLQHYGVAADDSKLLSLATNVPLAPSAAAASLKGVSKRNLNRIRTYHQNMARKHPQKQRTAKEQERRDKNTLACRLSRRKDILADEAMEKDVAALVEAQALVMDASLRAAAYLRELVILSVAAPTAAGTIDMDCYAHMQCQLDAFINCSSKRSNTLSFSIDNILAGRGNPFNNLR